MFGIVRLVFGTILKNLRKSSEGGQKSSENHQKRCHQHVYIIKRTLHGGLKIWILFSRGKNNILLTRCASQQNIVLPLENKIHIVAPPCNILYLLHGAVILLYPLKPVVIQAIYRRINVHYSETCQPYSGYSNTYSLRLNISYKKSI